MITLKRRGNKVMIIIPVSFIQSLRVAIQPCACGHTKSNRTSAIRSFWVKALGLALFMKSDETKIIQPEGVIKDLADTDG